MPRATESEKQHPSGPILFGIIVAIVVLFFAALFILRPASSTGSSGDSKSTTAPVSKH